MSYDRRRRVLESALFSADLSYAEKVFMIVVTTIKAEYVNGECRHGSRAMSPSGRFALHLDYLARAMSNSTEAVRKLQRSLVAKGRLGVVHEARFGRPTTFEAFAVRGAKNGTLTSGEIGTPYGLGDLLIRGADSAPLTYRTPVGSDHPPASGVSPTAVPQAESSNEGPCRFHGWAACPTDCADHPNVRRTA